MTLGMERAENLQSKQSQSQAYNILAISSLLELLLNDAIDSQRAAVIDDHVISLSEVFQLALPVVMESSLSEALQVE
jgi:hypothetical protein